ncbi:LuxR C-terminal-related transcriptional regulator [Streptomyces sp. NPDC003327]
MGKSHLLAEVEALPQAVDATRVVWRCGGPGPGPDLGAAPEADRGHGQGPVLLLVDDLHLADAEQRERLRILVEHPPPGLVAVVAYRPEELPTAGLPLNAPVAYPRELSVFRHRLRTWDVRQVGAAALEIAGEGCTQEAVARVCERSGGVPQVVVDLLSAMRERPDGACTAQDVEAAGVPVRLAELVLGRMYGLSPSYRPVVWAAAVLGEPARQEELAAVTGLGPEQCEEALTAALAGAALTEYDMGRYGLPSPLAALTVREVVPGPARRALHERAAGVLTRREPVRWTAVAEHRRAAGQVRGWLRAVEKATRAAAESGRYPEAVDLLEQTFASPAVPPQDRGRLAPLLAHSAVVGLRSDRTVEVLAQIVGDAALPLAVRGEVRLDLGLMLRNQAGDFAAGWRELEAAAGELRQARLPLAARAMTSLAMPYWPGPSLEVHQRWLREGTEIAEASSDQAVRAAVLADRAWFSLSCGAPDAWELLDALPTDSPNPACALHAARGLCNAADAALWLGFYQRAEDLLSEGLELSAKHRAPYTRHTALGTRLWWEWWTGRWDGLAERCEEFVTATADMPVIASDARMVRGLLAFAQGEWSTARSCLAGPHAPARENTPTPCAATTSGTLIRLALARQDLSAAAEQARSAWADTVAKGVWVWAAELAPWVVEALARAGDVNAAEAVVRDFARGIADREAPVARAALAWSRAALAEAEGSLLEAAEHYRDAASAYGALPRPYARTLTAERAARCTLAACRAEAGGDDGAGLGRGAEDTLAHAVTELESCAQQFSDLGAAWDAAHTRSFLRIQRPAVPGHQPASGGHPHQLTLRESEVVELAIKGMTNREIAATLHLSPRTVEQHIARAMRKTGALSRYDLGHHLT